jgi:hypothetical protein
MGNSNIVILAIFIAALLKDAPVLGQAKYEREYKIKKSNVPKEALSFVSDVFKDAKVRWYGEEGLKRSTIEAKLKYSGKSYSIEFSKSGDLEDIEVLTPFTQLPEDTRSAIKRNLSDTFKTYQVTKTQTQWVGSRGKLKAAVQEKELPQGIEVNYELIVKAKKTKMTMYFEVLCNSKGDIKSVHEIVQRNSDNLIY